MLHPPPGFSFERSSGVALNTKTRELRSIIVALWFLHGKSASSKHNETALTTPRILHPPYKLVDKTASTKLKRTSITLARHPRCLKITTLTLVSSLGPLDHIRPKPR